jgi:hypothetical protein
MGQLAQQLHSTSWVPHQSTERVAPHLQRLQHGRCHNADRLHWLQRAHVTGEPKQHQPTYDLAKQRGPKG